MDARAGSLWHKIAGEATPRNIPRHRGGPVWPEVELIRPPGGGGDGDVGQAGGGRHQPDRPAVHLQAGLALQAAAVLLSQAGGEDEEEQQGAGGQTGGQTPGQGAGHHTEDWTVGGRIFIVRKSPGQPHLIS